AGDRRVDAFATFNVYYQAGMLLGPLVEIALPAADFRLVCTVAAAVFAVLTVLQWRALPVRRGDTADATAGPGGVLAQWRIVVANRPFLLFSTAMIGSYVLTFQVCLALPLAAQGAPGSRGARSRASPGRSRCRPGGASSPWTRHPIRGSTGSSPSTSRAHAEVARARLRGSGRLTGRASLERGNATRRRPHRSATNVAPKDQSYKSPISWASHRPGRSNSNSQGSASPAGTVSRLAARQASP